MTDAAPTDRDARVRVDEIAGLEDELAAREQAAEAARRQTAAAMARAEQADQAHAAACARLEELQHRLEELQHQFEELHATRTLRWTSGLRRVYGAARRRQRG